MARAKFNMWASLQGEMGQIVFTEAPGGFIARQYVADPAPSKSPAVAAVRARFRKVAAFWNALDNASQTAWDEFAIREGRDPKALTDPTGYSKFSGLVNVWLNAHGDQGTPPANPPTGEYGNPGIDVSANTQPGLVVFVGSAATPAGTLVQFETQSLKRASRRPSKGGYRVAGFSALTVEDGLTYSVGVPHGAYCARYCFVEASSGRRTPFVEIPVTGVALALETGGAAEKPVSRKKAA